MTFHHKRSDAYGYAIITPTEEWVPKRENFEEYYAKKEEMLADYENRELWLKKVIVNIAKAGFFSSDRTIDQYNKEIWNK